VKIRGLRIELGEIENEIARYKGIKNVLVMAFGREIEKYLCAYYTSKEKVDEDALRESLRRTLPAYMIPSYFIALDDFPATPAGKIDRKALPDPQKVLRIRKTSGHGKTALSDTQKKMAKVWKQILRVQDIGPADNFFSLGGDSLAVIQVQTAILKFGFEIGTQDFYELQTLQAICDNIDNKIRSKAKTVSRIEKFALLEKNKPAPYFAPDARPADLSCVLLTGANGFLGAHILSELAFLYNSSVYCIMRADCDEEAREKLRISLSFYFGPDGAQKLLENVRVVRGNIALARLGIAEEAEREIAREVKTVIHCAALTSHYGMSEEFERTNVIGTENVADFCLNENKLLLHISTMSVAGSRVANDSDRIFKFDENCYYIGQEYADNEYRKSKFLAEAVVLKAQKEGLAARIFRAGNLTARMDGKFQMTPSSNAFASRIVSIFRIGAVPAELADWQMEFTPVDLCAKAILLLSARSGKKPFAYHILNPNTLAFKTFAEMVGSVAHPPAFVEKNEFNRLVLSYSRKRKGEMLSGIINDIVKRDTERSNLMILSETTQAELNDAGFGWPVLDEAYLTRYMNVIYKQP